MEQIKLFAKKFEKIIESDIQFLQYDSTEIEESLVESTWSKTNLTSISCTYCRVEFTDPSQQREHYKLDWHRYNLKQHLLSRQPVTEEEFNGKADDVSSISGSDTESEKEDNLESIAASQGKIFLQSKQGKVFAIYRCLLFEKKQEEIDVEILQKRLVACTVNQQWTVLMLGGGHFAGGVFKGDVPILHKTFHCYTVRAGQGGTQSSRDNRTGGSQPKSAGASLRRYNETALVQHIKDIVQAWTEEIAKSSLIIVRAAGPFNQSVLFGGKTPLLNKSDSRIRTIPFSTRRATFTELKRVHSLLTTLCIYESIELVLKQVPKQTSSPAKRSKIKSTHIDRAKSREKPERPLPTAPSSSSEDLSQEIVESLTLTTNEEEISLHASLQPFEDTLTPEQRQKGNKKNKKPKKSKNQRMREKEAEQKLRLFEIVKTGNINELEIFLKSDNKEEVVNEVVDEHGNSLLHIAAIQGQTEMIKFLLECNGDPCNKNDKHQTPYSCTQNKEVRNAFKEFAQAFPDKHNYNKAQIPLPVPTTEDQLERKKQQRKMKREKDKEKRKQAAIEKEENLEKERFLNLSDREKRALAAERRIINGSGSVLRRCFLCALDISGKIPFEYLNNVFCSVECLKAHRLSHSVSLS